jgi:hypothetical protein
MSLQTIVNHAQTITVDRRRIVGQTLSRSQRIKTAERNTAQPWKFTLTPSARLNWSQNRGVIESIMSSDRVGEHVISFAAHDYIAGYLGDLNSVQTGSMTIALAGVNSLNITNLPALGQTIGTDVRTAPARAFSILGSAFLMPQSYVSGSVKGVTVGLRVSHPVYLPSGTVTITAITNNYAVVDGVNYARISLSAAPSADSPVNEGDITVQILADRTVSATTVLFRQGDVIQPNNSRYPYTVKSTVLRGSGSTATVTTHRNIITSEDITLVGQTLRVGSACTWRVVVTGLPQYQFVQRNQIQFTGDFELIEKVI